MASRILVRAVVLSATLAAFACDDTFEPFLSGSDLRFSVFGYLNAAADTQWIRVTPIRESVFTEPGDLGAAVTLEHMETGETIVLHDSIFRYATLGLDGGAEAWAHNFWTDTPIEHDATYKLSVVAADGATTEVMVPVPEGLPEIVIETRVVSETVGGRFGFPGTNLQNVVLAPVENLAMVRVIHHIADRTRATLANFIDCALPSSAPRVHSLRQPLGQALTVGDITELPISGTLDPRLLGERAYVMWPCVVGRREVVVASSGSSWPTGVQFSAAAPAITQAPSAVEGGVGFVGGVVIRTVPFENCDLRPRTIGAVCEMRYNDQTLTIEGTIVDSMCDWGVEGAVVELSELGGTGPTVIRTAKTDQDGRYWISGLVGGTSYGLLVTHPLRWAPDDGFATQHAYLDHEDILSFGPGQTVSHDIVLQRQVPCVYVPE